MDCMKDYEIFINRVIDGDTVECTVCLGFDILLSNQKIRICGIDTPESRSKDKAERYYGLLAKRRLEQLLNQKPTLVSSGKKGKFGRILGDFKLPSGDLVSNILIKEFYAVPYLNQHKNDIQQMHYENRAKLDEMFKSKGK